MKVKITRKQREAGRQEAAERFEEVAGMAAEARRNDEIGSHYTFWFAGGDRVDWWPGARHWRGPDGDQYGEASDFIEWLKGAAS